MLNSGTTVAQISAFVAFFGVVGSSILLATRRLHASRQSRAGSGTVLIVAGVNNDN